MSPEQQVDYSLQQLLDQELDCFSQILDGTDTFLDKLDSLSQISLVKLLNSRQKWIDKIKVLREKRDDMKEIDYEIGMVYIEQNLTDLAKTLIMIDANILDILQIIDPKYINEIITIVEV